MSSSPGIRKQKVLAPDAGLEQLIQDRSHDTLIAVASDRRLTEDLALALLNRRDLPGKVLEELFKNVALAKQKKVRLAIVIHLRTPRHISIPIIRYLYVFELMQVALFPAVPADVKRMAEEAIIGKLANISSGERHSLAKQSSGRVAAAMLLDKEERIMQAALVNPQMTEALLARALRTAEGTELLVAAVCCHEKWSRRLEVKTALLTNKNTPLPQVVQFARELPVNILREILYSSRLDPEVKSYLKSVVEKRTSVLRSRPRRAGEGSLQ
jgi:hypothetical protein